MSSQILLSSSISFSHDAAFLSTPHTFDILTSLRQWSRHSFDFYCLPSSISRCKSSLFRHFFLVSKILVCWPFIQFFLFLPLPLVPVFYIALSRHHFYLPFRFSFIQFHSVVAFSTVRLLRLFSLISLHPLFLVFLSLNHLFRFSTPYLFSALT